MIAAMMRPASVNHCLVVISLAMSLSFRACVAHTTSDSDEVVSSQAVADLALDFSVIQDQLLVVDPTSSSIDEITLQIIKAIYEKGGNAGSYARLTLTLDDGSADFLNQNFTKNDRVYGLSEDNVTIEGRGWGNQSVSINRPYLDVIYRAPNPSAAACRVGGLPLEAQVTSGCFAAQGNVLLDDDDNGTRALLSYTYSPLVDNQNRLRLASASKNAQQSWLGCPDCPWTRRAPFGEYYSYYGHIATYADVVVTSALDGASFTAPAATGLDNKTYVEFSKFNGASRAAAAQTAILALGVWMEVFRWVQQTVHHCHDGVKRVTLEQTWNLATTYYTGINADANANSTTNTAQQGTMLHSWIDELCRYFKTCGRFSNEPYGRAYVNGNVLELLEQPFQKALGMHPDHHAQQQQQPVTAEFCASLQSAQSQLQSLLTVPLIQSLLWHAYTLSVTTTNSSPPVPYDYKKDVASTSIGSAVVSTLALLPLVHQCNSSDADELLRLHEQGIFNMTVFTQLKSLLEHNLGCLGVTCTQVGGIYFGDLEQYAEGADPCQQDGSLGVPGGITLRPPRSTPTPTTVSPSSMPSSPSMPRTSAPSLAPTETDIVIDSGVPPDQPPLVGPERQSPPPPKGNQEEAIPSDNGSSPNLTAVTIACATLVGCLVCCMIVMAFRLSKVMVNNRNGPVGLEQDGIVHDRRIKDDMWMNEE